MPKGLLLMLQGEADDEGAVAAAQEEAGAGAEREVALLHSRLRLLAAHALVSAAPHPPHPPCCASSQLLSVVGYSSVCSAQITGTHLREML